MERDKCDLTFVSFQCLVDGEIQKLKFIRVIHVVTSACKGGVFPKVTAMGLVHMYLCDRWLLHFPLTRLATLHQ